MNDELMNFIYQHKLLKWMHFGPPLLFLGMSAAFLSSLSDRTDEILLTTCLSGRTLTALTFVQSALVYGGLLSAYRVIFRSDLVFKLLPEIWRVITPFLLTGPKLSFLLDLYFSMIMIIYVTSRYQSRC